MSDKPELLIKTTHAVPVFFSAKPLTLRLALASLLFLPVLLSIGCAPSRGPVLRETPGPLDAEMIVSGIRNQEEIVSAFYTTGTVFLKDSKWRSEAHMLTAGIKAPYRIKIEITHPWGNPIIHILIDDDKVEILSFSEKKVYIGRLSHDSLSRFLPVKFINRSLLWSILRGYPHILRYHGIGVQKMNRISLWDPKGREIEIIYLAPESLLPEIVSFPEQQLMLTFKRLKDNKGIYYASEVGVKSAGKGKNLIIKNKDMVFNTTIPEPIFILDTPPDFEAVYLDELPVNPEE